MKSICRILPWGAALPLALQLLATPASAAPQEPPTFDVNPSCRAAAAVSGEARMQGCLDSENNARAQLVKEWDQFTPAIRATCLKASTAGGEPTYTEFITCLEMDRDARQKPAGDASPKSSNGGLGPETTIDGPKAR